MKKLRLPAFIFAIILLSTFLGIEIGTTFLPVDANADASTLLDGSQGSQDALKSMEIKKSDHHSRPPGVGVPSIAMVDILLAFSVAHMAFSLVIPRDKESKVQGCITVIFSFLMFWGAFAAIFVFIAMILVMIALLIAIPFGTIIYLIIYGHFNRGGAAGILSTIMGLKIAFSVALLVAHQRMITNKGFVLLVLTSIVATIIVSMLHGMVPRFLVSITDGVAGVVNAIIAAIWCIILLIGAIPSIPLALKT